MRDNWRSLAEILNPPPFEEPPPEDLTEPSYLRHLRKLHAKALSDEATIRAQIDGNGAYIDDTTKRQAI